MTASTCPLPAHYEEYLISPVPVVGSLTLQRLLFIIAAAAAIATNVVSFFLITKHLHRYTEPKQQRQIIRIIFTPVVFATLSALSILNYQVAKYLQPLIDLYETFALAALFLLYVEYVAPDKHTRSNFFATLEMRKPKNRFLPWKGYKVIPGGSQKWFSIKYAAVFLYVIIDIVMTVLEEVTLANGDYCATSWSPRFAHIWVTVITNVFLGAAIGAIVEFYTRMKNEGDFPSHKPGLKLVSFKLIVGINFIQSIVFDLIDVQTSQKMTGYDLRYGIPAALVAVEQLGFATFFHYSFRSREYHETMKEDLVSPRMGMFRAAANAFNPIDLLVGMVTALKLVVSLVSPSAFQGSQSRRGRQQGYGDDMTHLEPMSQRERLRSSSPYPSQPIGITVTNPGETRYSNTYDGSGFDAPAYPPHASLAGDVTNVHLSTQEYDEGDDASSRLNPYTYARTHSRDSSVDAAETRSTRQVV